MTNSQEKVPSTDANSEMMGSSNTLKELFVNMLHEVQVKLLKMNGKGDNLSRKIKAFFKTEILELKKKI